MAEIPKRSNSNAIGGQREEEEEEEDDDDDDDDEEEEKRSVKAAPLIAAPQSDAVGTNQRQPKRPESSEIE